MSSGTPPNRSWQSWLVGGAVTGHLDCLDISQHPLDSLKGIVGPGRPGKADTDATLDIRTRLAFGGEFVETEEALIGMVGVVRPQRRDGGPFDVACGIG